MEYCEELNSKISVLRDMKLDVLNKMNELLLDEKVREFLSLYEENEKLGKLIDKNERELLHHKFETCNHAYVMTDISFINGQTPIYKCVKCGLTNESSVRGNEMSLVYPFSLMGSIFEDTFHKSSLIYDGLGDVDFEEIAKIYEIVTSEYPDISLNELRDKIKNEVSILKKMLSKNN